MVVIAFPRVSASAKVPRVLYPSVSESRERASERGTAHGRVLTEAVCQGGCWAGRPRRRVVAAAASSGGRDRAMRAGGRVRQFLETGLRQLHCIRKYLEADFTAESRVRRYIRGKLEDILTAY